MVQGERRSIRQIELSPNRAQGRRYDEDGADAFIPGNGGPSSAPPRRKQKSFSWRGAAWLIAALAVIGVSIALSAFFSKTTLTAFPKQFTVPIENQFQAFKSPKTGELPFKVLTVQKAGSESVPSNGKEDASVRASGQIVVYNDYSAATQRLIRNTRFESSDKKIYRIDKSVVVPGKTGAGPGSIEVTVYADEPGDSYNIDLTDFTVPGFKGTPQYSKFYGRSKTPMTGGFVGKRLTADPSVVAKQREDLQAKLRSELIALAVAQKPEDAEMYDGAIFVDHSPLQNTDSGTSILIQEQATLHALLFSKNELSRAIATATALSPGEGVALTLADDSTLVFTLAEEDINEPWSKESFFFGLAGNAHLVALFDGEALKRDLAGKSKSALPTVLSGYQGIEHAEVAFRPFWKQTFPTKVEEIIVISAPATVK